MPESHSSITFGDGSQECTYCGILDPGERHQDSCDFAEPDQWEHLLMSAQEVITTSESGGRKGTKPERYDLIPVEPLAAVARHYGVGATKYDDHNWRKGYEWSKSYAALQRHANAFWRGEDIDPETGSPHLAAVVFHAFSMMEWMRTHPEYDDRYKGDG